MNKILKITTALLLSLVLLVGVGAPAFATTDKPGTGTAVLATPESTANITVDTGNVGDTLNLYKVLDITLEDNVLIYKFTETPATNPDQKGFREFLVDPAGGNKPEGYTETQYLEDYESDTQALDELLGNFTAWARVDNVEPIGGTATVDNDGKATFSDVPMGQYIIIGTGGATGAVIYQTVTAEVIPHIAKDEANIDRYYIYPDYTVTMKTTSEPGAAKTVNTPSVNIGGELEYKLRASVPAYPVGSTNTTFFMKDTLGSGLSLKDIEVKGYSGSGDLVGEELVATDYTVSYDGQTFYVDFNYDQIKRFACVGVEYTAILNENAIIAGEGNKNDYTLIFSNSPFEGRTYDPNVTVPAVRPGAETSGYGSKTDTKIIKTYGLLVDKYKDGEIDTKLGGAKFEIYTTPTPVGGEIPLGTITTDEKGQGVFLGLEPGVYYLEETEAPAGYKKLVNRVKVEITSDNQFNTTVNTKREVTYTSDVNEATIKTQAINSNGEKLYIDSEGNLVTTGTESPAYLLSRKTIVTADTEGQETTLQKLEIVNAEGATLPTTGGMGTKIFTFIGLAIMLGSLILLITKRRMSDKA